MNLLHYSLVKSLGTMRPEFILLGSDCSYSFILVVKAQSCCRSACRGSRPMQEQEHGELISETDKNVFLQQKCLL